MAYYRASARLQHLVLNRRCYSLLDKAKIDPHSLYHFYRTYRLPADPFFPLFFTVKRSYLAQRERLKEERHAYIMNAMRSLPEPVLRNIKYLGYLERGYNSAGRSPIWQRDLFPASKKKADEYMRFSDSQWLALFRSHLSMLAARYGGLPEAIADRVYACFVLGITPELIPPSRPTPQEVSRSYRRLSLLHHPDRGGNSAMFIEIKRARDALVEHAAR